MKTTTEAYACDNCGKVWLKKDDLYKCIHCGVDICQSINCSYKINITVHHDIPNGIPFLITQARYRICKKCLKLSDFTICKELYDLLMPKENAKLYRHGDVRRGEEEWVKVMTK